MRCVVLLWCAVVLLACSGDGGDGTCSSDQSCPMGRYCGSDGLCTADCVVNSDCSVGVCNDRGKCGPITVPAIDGGGIDAAAVDANTVDGAVAPDANPFPGNNSPVASFTMNPTCTELNTTEITFTSTSTEPDGDPMTCAWTFSSGTPPSATGCVVSGVTFPNAAPYNVRLTVRDNKNGVDVDNKSIAPCL